MAYRRVVQGLFPRHEMPNAHTTFRVGSLRRVRNRPTHA
jgi:hypothetical protein